MRLKNIFLCDAVTANQDNTFSVLRGGVDRFSMSNINEPIKLALIATIELDVSERGRLHTAELSLLDIDGQKILPPLQLHFQAPAGNTKYKHNLICDLLVRFKKFGECCFYINVDGQELGSHSLYVVEAPTIQQSNQ